MDAKRKRSIAHQLMHGFVLLVIAVFVLIPLLIAVAAWLDHLRRTPPGAKNNAARANLHDIQLALERYAVDHGGVYPAYLIGGEAKYAAAVGTLGGTNMFQGITDCDRAQVSDALLREGYLDAYPRNPFVRDGRAVHQAQEQLPTSFTGDDPLRNGAPEGAALGTRFGPDCTTMGQVLCDPRYPQWEQLDPATGVTTTRDSWAVVEYQFWDMTPTARKQDPVLAISPGQFFYKSMGPIAIPASAFANGIVDEKPPIIPTRTEYYILGVYGAIVRKGQDGLGEEQEGEFMVRQSSGQLGNGRIWPWTRSQLKPPARMGSPYRQLPGGWESLPGNPNGIPDGIALMLDGGQLPSDG